MLMESRRLAAQLVDAGDLAAKEGDPQEAERHYRHAAEVSDEYDLPRIRLGELYMNYAQWEAAYEAFTEAFVRGAEGAGFERNYGLAAIGCGNFPRAENRLERSLELDPESIDAKVKLAYAKGYLGKKSEALALLADVLKAEPSNSDAQRVREMVLKIPEGQDEDR